MSISSPTNEGPPRSISPTLNRTPQPTTEAPPASVPEVPAFERTDRRFIPQPPPHLPPRLTAGLDETEASRPRALGRRKHRRYINGACCVKSRTTSKFHRQRLCVDNFLLFRHLGLRAPPNEVSANDIQSIDLENRQKSSALSRLFAGDQAILATCFRRALYV